MTYDTTQAETIEAFAEAYPFMTPGYIYCLFTGAPLAEIESQEWNLLLSMLRGTTPESRAHELARRVLASSRPGLLWNHLRTEDISTLKINMPADALAYMLNGGKGIAKGRDFVIEMLARIERYVELSGLDGDEIESRWLRYHMQVDTAKEEANRHESAMRRWLESRDETGQEAARRRRVEAIETHAEVLRMKRGARRAAVERKFGPSPTTQKKRASAQKVSMAWGILSALADFDSTSPASPPAPAPAPVTGKVAFVIARKDS
jgi:hypothetical protein